MESDCNEEEGEVNVVARAWNKQINYMCWIMEDWFGDV